MIGGDVPFYAKIWRILTYPLQNADFQAIFARSSSAVTPSKKVQLTLTGVVHCALSNELKMNIVRCP